ncbi:brevican core protein [Pelodytes ibericus]
MATEGFTEKESNMQRRSGVNMKLDLRLLLLLAHAWCTSTSDTEDDLKTFKVRIDNSTVSAVLAGSLRIPCHITYRSPLEAVNVGRRGVLAMPRVKWSFIDNGKEVEILVARGHKVKISEGYRYRASMPLYSTSMSDMTLVLNELRTNDSGIYRCHVQHGIDDDQDKLEVKVKGVVFLYREGIKRYAYTFFMAQAACSRIRASIATADQLLAAYQSGYEQCDAGWIADQTVRYPIQTPREGCYGDMDGFPGVRNYGVLDPDDLYDVYCYVEELNGEVFLGSTANKFTLEEAKDYCRTLGGQIATTGQIYAAWSEGLDHCSPGWLSDGSVRYPIVSPSERCGGNSSGVKTIFQFRNQTGFPDSHARYDVYCFRGRHAPAEGIRDVITLTDTFEELKISDVKAENEAQGSVDTIPLGATDAVLERETEVLNASIPTDKELPSYPPTEIGHITTGPENVSAEFGTTQTVDHSVFTQEEPLMAKNTTGLLLQSFTESILGLVPILENKSVSSTDNMTGRTPVGNVNLPTQDDLTFINVEAENEYPDDNITLLIEEMGLAESSASPSSGGQDAEEANTQQFSETIHGENKVNVGKGNEHSIPSTPAWTQVYPTGTSTVEVHTENRAQFPITHRNSESHPTLEANDFGASGQEENSLISKEGKSLILIDGSTDEPISGDALEWTHFSPMSESSYPFTDAKIAEVQAVTAAPLPFSMDPSSHSSMKLSLEEGSGDISGPIWVASTVGIETTSDPHTTKLVVDQTSSTGRTDHPMFGFSTVSYNGNPGAHQEPSTAQVSHLMSPDVSSVLPTIKDSEVEAPQMNTTASETLNSVNLNEGFSGTPLLPMSNPVGSTNQGLENSSQPSGSISTLNHLPAVPTERAIHGASINLSDDCFPNPCENGGTCLEEEDGDFHCLCLPGYIGKICDINVEECLGDWDTFQGFCYKHFHIRRSWEEAETHCRDSGGHLISIMTPEEQDFVNNKYREYQWTGLNDRTIEGDFQWSDGNALLYENWNHQQPDSYFLSGENCVVMVWHDSGHWSDVPCNYHLPYTCKMGLVSCGAPPEVANASTYGRLKTRYQIGSIVGYGCEEGFLQRNSPIIKCLADGLWEEPQINCMSSVTFGQPSV